MSKGGGGVHILSFFVSLFYFLFLYISIIYYRPYHSGKKDKVTQTSFTMLCVPQCEAKEATEREREREALDGVVRKKDGKNIKALIAACTIEWSH